MVSFGPAQEERLLINLTSIHRCTSFCLFSLELEFGLVLRQKFTYWLFCIYFLNLWEDERYRSVFIVFGIALTD